MLHQTLREWLLPEELSVQAGPNRLDHNTIIRNGVKKATRKFRFFYCKLFVNDPLPPPLFFERERELFFAKLPVLHRLT